MLSENFELIIYITININIKFDANKCIIILLKSIDVNIYILLKYLIYIFIAFSDYVENPIF